MAQIDTLATARRLEHAGLPTEQARAVSEAISDAIRDSQPDWSEIATKEFVRSEIQTLRAELRADLQELRAELRGELRSQMIWFFVMLVAVTGAGITLSRMFPTP